MITLTEIAKSAAYGVAFWRAEMVAPTSWASADYGQGFCRGSLHVETATLRKVLPGMSKKFRREIGDLIRNQLHKLVAENRELMVRVRRAA